jgi:hypothetical protein
LHFCTFFCILMQRRKGKYKGWEVAFLRHFHSGTEGAGSFFNAR